MLELFPLPHFPFQPLLAPALNKLSKLSSARTRRSQSPQSCHEVKRPWDGTGGHRGREKKGEKGRGGEGKSGVLARSSAGGDSVLRWGYPYRLNVTLGDKFSLVPQCVSSGTWQPGVCEHNWNLPWPPTHPHHYRISKEKGRQGKTKETPNKRQGPCEREMEIYGHSHKLCSGWGLGKADCSALISLAELALFRVWLGRR